MAHRWSVPGKRATSKRTPGWNDYAASYKDQAMFWHILWKENGSPHAGIVADIRRRTRAKYHKILRQLQNNQKQIRSLKMAQTILQSDRRDFWSEVKKLRGKGVNVTNVVDNSHGEENIVDVFAQKYKELYNSVPYNVEEMTSLRANINNMIRDHGDCEQHGIQVSDVIDNVPRMKPDKHDGYKGHFSNHIINGTHRLFCYISLLFDSMVNHGSVPKDIWLSTLIPIPKNKRKSLNIIREML